MFDNTVHINGVIRVKAHQIIWKGTTENNDHGAQQTCRKDRENNDPGKIVYFDRIDYHIEQETYFWRGAFNTI